MDTWADTGFLRDLVGRAGEACLLFGDRSLIDVGARKVYTTLRYLGLLDNPSDGVLVAADRVVVSPALVGWVAHALPLTRQLDAIDGRELTSAPSCSR